jgi:glycosyl transferase family 2
MLQGSPAHERSHLRRRIRGRGANPRTRVVMIDVVLPVLDDAHAIPGVLAAMPPGFRALVVDNGSGDGSAEVAGASGARVVIEPRRGFGSACYAALMAAESEVVCVSGTIRAISAMTAQLARPPS